MRYWLLGALGVILMFSTISMAKPWFYLLSLNTKGQLDLELGPPYAENVLDEKNPDITEYLYRGGHIKPLCIDYAIRYTQYTLTSWTWRFCQGAPETSASPGTAEDTSKPFRN
jgi:hypothetical protein